MLINQSLDTVLNRLPRYSKISCDALSAFVYESGLMDEATTLPVTSLDFQWIKTYLRDILIPVEVPEGHMLTGDDYILTLLECLIVIRNELTIVEDEELVVTDRLNELIADTMKLYKIERYILSKDHEHRVSLALDRLCEYLAPYDSITVVGWQNVHIMSLLIIDD